MLLSLLAEKGDRIMGVASFTTSPPRSGQGTGEVRGVTFVQVYFSHRVILGDSLWPRREVNVFCTPSGRDLRQAFYTAALLLSCDRNTQTPYSYFANPHLQLLLPHIGPRYRQTIFDRQKEKFKYPVSERFQPSHWTADRLSILSK